MVDTYHTEKGDEVANMVLYMMCLLLALYVYSCVLSASLIYLLATKRSYAQYIPQTKL